MKKLITNRLSTSTFVVLSLYTDEELTEMQYVMYVSATILQIVYLPAGCAMPLSVFTFVPNLRNISSLRNVVLVIYRDHKLVT